MDVDFVNRELPYVHKRVHRLGLATSYGLDEKGIEEALERGLNYLFWTPLSTKLSRVLRSLSSDARDKLVITTGPTLGFTRGAFRRRVDKVLRVLKTDRLDVLQLYWLGRTSMLSAGVVDELQQLKESGKVRAVGISIHDRVRAGQLAEASPLDLFMIRYNAAHPGAEHDIFPHLHTRHPAVVAYTATSWRKLLRKPSGFAGPPATAGDCYRFCLSSPHVHVVLTGPRDTSELRENLSALEKGPLSDDEMKWMRELGQAVHG